ncbi:hypothetical protein AVEN_161245-1 [Araneus ventricosus]|uniref:Uncharacterized protein n=1 Tax=Araneus ventricosus TaxID=182803 RepID=A0A4Y2KL49_ARAVE|nr:hypothetical protein AVEN_161245-1 [Araneus ventricosus]
MQHYDFRIVTKVVLWAYGDESPKKQENGEPRFIQYSQMQHYDFHIVAKVVLWVYGEDSPTSRIMENHLYSRIFRERRSTGNRKNTTLAQISNANKQ